MAKKQTRLEELWDAEIDYSMPIDRFARKAKALLNKLAREMKVYNLVDNAQYNDGSACIQLNTSISTKLIAKFDKEVRKLAANHKELKKLKLPITRIEMRSYEINIVFC